MVLGIVKGKARQEACCHFQRLRPCRNDRFFGITGVETRRKQALELLTSTRTPRIQHYLASHSIYMCVYIYIYIYIFMYTNIHTYIHSDTWKLYYLASSHECWVKARLWSLGHPWQTWRQWQVDLHSWIRHTCTM